MRRYEHGGDIYSEPGSVLDFSVNINPLGLPKAVKQAVIADTEGFSRYPDPHCRKLKAALSEHFGVAAGQILCGNGASDMIFRVCACLKPRHALVLAPTFSEYERSAMLFGARISEHRLKSENGFAVTDALLDALTGDVDMLFLCNPNNPTGRLADESLLEAVALRCRDMGITLLIDECFLPFTTGRSLMPFIRSCPRLLILRAFTKLYSMAGLRLGCLIGEDSLIEEIGRFGAQWSVSSAAQTAGIAALSTEPEWSADTRAAVKREREFMNGGLSSLGIEVFPSEANFLLLKSDAPLCEGLRRQGIAVRDCSSFTGLDGGYIRIGLKSRSENERLLKAIGKLISPP